VKVRRPYMFWGGDEQGLKVNIINIAPPNIGIITYKIKGLHKNQDRFVYQEKMRGGG